MSDAGKGDAYRPVDTKKFNENYDRIFSQEKEKLEDEEQSIEGGQE
jgi:hypothetical protein